MIEPQVRPLWTEMHALEQEFVIAVLCHEAWKPAAYDQTLQERMSSSSAGNTFHVIRQALRREMLMALMRLWDNSKGSITLRSLLSHIKNTDVIAALAAHTAANYWGYQAATLREEYSQKASAAISIIESYDRRGTKFAALDKLRKLRHQVLAHRQRAPADAKADEQEMYDKMVDDLYQDTFNIMRLLLTIVHSQFQPDEAAGAHARDAKFFWAAVRGEMTEGHPNFVSAPP